MRMHLLMFIFLWVGCGMAQVSDTKAAPQVKSVTIEESRAGAEGGWHAVNHASQLPAKC